MNRPEHHWKGWGYELWIHNDEKYCGKLLFFEKDEIESVKEILLTPGDTFEVPPGLRHRMFAVEDSELFEFSTEHFEDDSYRVIKGD